jgi:nucleoid DNA-binding protein
MIPIHIVKRIEEYLEMNLVQKIETEQIEKVCRAFCNHILENVQNGENVCINNFAMFRRVKRKSGRYGLSVQVPKDALDDINLMLKEEKYLLN